MDIARSQPKTSKLKKPLLLGAGLALLGGLIATASQYQFTGFVTDRSKLRIATVVQGDLKVTVRGNGTLVPSDVRWIAANVDGRVERVLVKPGAVIKQGDLLLELSNPALEQKLEETRWELEAVNAETEALAVSLRNQLLDQKAKMLNAKMQYESARLRLDAEQTLLKAGKSSVSQIDYQKSKLEARQFKQRWEIQQQRLAGMGENNTAQLKAKKARLAKLQKTLMRAQEQVASMQITATLNGVVQEMPLEPGQRIGIGGNIAKLARQDALIAELKIPERQIRDVAIGQAATIDTRRNKVIGRVVRIDPAVINGTVQVDVEFEQPLPPEARPDLSIDGTIEISHLSDTVYVKRPTFAQSQSASVIYKLNTNGSDARKTKVNFGVGSAAQIQIIDGLNPGDQIILSDHSAWEHLDLIAIR